MTALNILRFNGFTLRPAEESDRTLAEQWTAWDKDHAGQIEPSFWLEQRLGIDSVLVLDHEGPVFFFKVALLAIREDSGPLPVQLVGLSQETIAEVRPVHMVTRAQIFIQFMPCATEEDRERTRAALIQGTEWLLPVLASSGAEEVFFDSRNEKLISFCVKRLGFEISPQGRQQGKAALAGMLRLRKVLGPGAAFGKMEAV